MEQEDQGNNHRTLEISPLKRRRGRPRKYPRTNVNREENAVPRVQNLQRQENAPNPPGFAGVNDNQPCQVNANDIMVGQVVHGVIDATFDAGYLLTVRVGNSDNTLRGVVFKPGQYIPVAADNDVAPNVPMIRRNEVPIPANHLNQVHVHNPRTRERNELANFNRNRTAKLVVSRARHMSPVPILPAHPVPNNKVVPVVLQPVNLSTGGTVSSQTPPDLTIPAPLEASKGKQVNNASSSDASKPTNQVKTVENQLLPSPATSNQGTLQTEATTMKLPCPPFENLLTEVINRVQNPAQLNGTQQKNLKNENNMDQPLCIEPLQTVVPVSPTSLPKPFENFRTGKMTELLRAVQEKMMDNQSHQTEEPARGSRPCAEVEQEDEVNGHSQASSV